MGLNDATALNYIDNLSCHRLNMALRMICQDEMGKQAVRESMKLVMACWRCTAPTRWGRLG